MSFGTSSNHFANKESDMLGQSINDPCNDFFQYLNFDSVEAAEDSSFAVDSKSPHVVSSTSHSNSAGTSTSVDAEARKIDLLLQPWLGESTENQFAESFNNQLPAGTSIYSEKSGRAAISDSELLSLEGITISSPKPPSLPSSPTQSASQSANKSARRRDRILSSVFKTFKRRDRSSQATLRAPAQKSNGPPKMMSSSRYSQDWEQRAVLDEHKFDFGFPQHGLPLSPPPSARVSDASSNGTAMMYKAEGQGNDFYNPHNFPSGVNNYTPLTTPISPEGFVDMPNLQVSIDSQYPSTPLQSPWGQTSNTGGFADYRGSPAFATDNEASPLWWNHATSTEVAHPSPSVYHNDPHYTHKSLAMQLQNDVTYNNSNPNCNSSAMPSGLMIQMLESPNQQSYIIEASPRTQGDFFAPPQQHRNSNSFNSTSNQRSSRHRRHNRSASPPHTPSPKSHSHSHSRSWSHSQTLRSSLTKGNRDNSNSNQNTKRSSRTPSRKSSSNNISAQRSQSLQSPVVDFVNFTPSDSMRILTGVAPSGSSKTKARREKEANEKRRRLSMAAMRAVRAAGGDVESLVEEGLFV